MKKLKYYTKIYFIIYVAILTTIIPSMVVTLIKELNVPYQQATQVFEGLVLYAIFPALVISAMCTIIYFIYSTTTTKTLSKRVIFLIGTLVSSSFLISYSSALLEITAHLFLPLIAIIYILKNKMRKNNGKSV